EFDVTFYVDYNGFVTKENSPISVTMAPKVKVKLMTLIAPPGVQCKYKTSLTYKKTKPKASVTPSGRIQRTTGIKLNEKKVNVFTQDGCARCEFVISYLEQNKISYVELNTTIHAPNNDLMFEKLEAAGFKAGSVTMPVIYHKGILEYNIKDISNWVKKITQ
ncbi:MAG: hypothetical protein WAU01_01365, partial [Saprospiraceae bacterium]